jgi:hypothetical protein
MKACRRGVQRFWCGLKLSGLVSTPSPHRRREGASSLHAFNGLAGSSDALRDPHHILGLGVPGPPWISPRLRRTCIPYCCSSVMSTDSTLEWPCYPHGSDHLDPHQDSSDSTWRAEHQLMLRVQPGCPLAKWLGRGEQLSFLQMW